VFLIEYNKHEVMSNLRALRDKMGMRVRNIVKVVSANRE